MCDRDSEISSWSDLSEKIECIQNNLPFMFNDNNILFNQIRVQGLNGGDPEYGGLWQLEEERFEETKNRKEKNFWKIYEAIDTHYHLDWNAVHYGHLGHSSLQSLIAAMLNVELNFLEYNKGPGVSSGDQCKYIQENVIDSRYESFSFEACQTQLEANEMDEADNALTQISSSMKILLQPGLSIINVPLNDIMNEQTNDFDTGFSLELKDEAGHSYVDYLEYGQKMSKRRSYVSLATNCREPTDIQYLTDFSDADPYNENLAKKLTFNAAYDLTNMTCDENISRPSLCIYTINDEKNHDAKYLQINTTFATETSDDYLSDDYYDSLIPLNKFVRTNDCERLQAAYDNWANTTDLASFNLIWTPNHESPFEDSIYRSMNRDISSQITSDRKFINRRLASALRFQPSKAQIAGPAAAFIFIVIVLVGYFCLNKYLQKKEEPETIYTMVRAAPASLKRSLTARFSRGTKRKENKQKEVNPGLPAGWSP